MRKLLAAFLAVALIAACGDDKKDNKPAKGSPEKPTAEKADPAPDTAATPVVEEPAAPAPAPTTVVEEPAAPAPAPTTVAEEPAAAPAPVVEEPAVEPAATPVVEEPAAPAPAPTTVVEESAAAPAPTTVVEEPAAPAPAPTAVAEEPAAAPTAEASSVAHNDFASKINELFLTDAGVNFITALTKKRIVAFSNRDEEIQAALKKETADAIAGMISDGKTWEDFSEDLNGLVLQDSRKLPKRLLKSFEVEYKRLITPAEVEK